MAQQLTELIRRVKHQHIAEIADRGDFMIGLRSPARAVRPELNAGLRGEVVGDGPVVAGHGGRGGVDLLDEQCEGAGDAGGAG